MTVRRVALLAAGALLLSALLAAAVSAWQPWRQTEQLSREEAIASVLRVYDGEVKSADLDGSVYRIALAMDTGHYALEVDAVDGAVLRIARDGEPAPAPTSTPVTPGSSAEPGPSPQPSPTPVPSAPPDEPTGSPGPTEPAATATAEPTATPPALMNREEAARVALRHVAGTVKDVEEGGNRDFLVEIETDDGQEAVVQINRVSGALMSVTWDDDDDDQDDRDDDERDDDGDDDR